MTKDYPEALMVAIDAEAIPEMPVQGTVPERQMLSVGGDQPGSSPKWGSKRPDEVRYIVPSLSNSCLALTTFSQQILALATTTEAYESEMFYFYCIVYLKSEFINAYLCHSKL